MASKNPIQEFAIKNGPSTLDIMFNHFDRTQERHVEFMFEVPGMHNHVARIRITGCKWWNAMTSFDTLDPSGTRFHAAPAA